MKNHLSSSLFLVLPIATILIAFTGPTPSDNKYVTEMQDGFRVGFELTEEGILMQCVEGCAWLNLHFSCTNGACSQQLNFFGMVTPPKTIDDVDQTSGSFLIDIQRDGYGITLTCLFGCEWDELEFDLDEDHPAGSFTTSGH